MREGLETPDEKIGDQLDLNPVPSAFLEDALITELLELLEPHGNGAEDKLCTYKCLYTSHLELVINCH